MNQFTLFEACDEFQCAGGKFYGENVEILDTSEIVAHSLRAWLEQHYLTNEKGEGKRQFYVSDYTLSFEQSTNIFFGRQIQLEHYPLWE